MPVWTKLCRRFNPELFTSQETRDAIPTLWIASERLTEVLRYLKDEIAQPYRMLYDLSAVDERFRQHRRGLPASDFTLVYHLASFGRNEELRIKVPLRGLFPSAPSITDLWANANWWFSRWTRVSERFATLVQPP